MPELEERKAFTTMWIDPRKFQQCSVSIMIIIMLVAWALVSVAVAQSLPEKAGDSVKIADLIRFQWWAITGLLGLLGVVVGVFIMREFNGQKVKIRDLYDKKLDKTAHDDMDHSGLCAFCRTKELHSHGRHGG